MAIWCFEEHVLWGRTAQNVQMVSSLVSDNAASPVGGASESPHWQAWWFKRENIPSLFLTQVHDSRENPKFAFPTSNFNEHKSSTSIMIPWFHLAL